MGAPQLSLPQLEAGVGAVEGTRWEGVWAAALRVPLLGCRVARATSRAACVRALCCDHAWGNGVGGQGCGDRTADHNSACRGEGWRGRDGASAHPVHGAVGIMSLLVLTARRSPGLTVAGDEVSGQPQHGETHGKPTEGHGTVTGRWFGSPAIATRSFEASWLPPTYHPFYMCFPPRFGKLKNIQKGLTNRYAPTVGLDVNTRFCPHPLLHPSGRREEIPDTVNTSFYDYFSISF